jgi:L-lactate dehydrogenase complex protein LldG
MRRVRAALGRDDRDAPAPIPAPPAVDETIVRLGHADADLAHRFATQAGLVGMKVHRIRAADLVKTLLAILGELNAKRVVVGVGALAQGVEIKDALRRKGITIVDWRAAAEQGGPGASFAVQFDTDAGITDVQAAIAESGTLVCCSGPGHSRGLSLVPPHHLAIVRGSDLLPDLIDYFAKVTPGSTPTPGSTSTPGSSTSPGNNLPSSIAFITGPSKTADIEGQLVTGVHGPGVVHILLVEDA